MANFYAFYPPSGASSGAASNVNVVNTPNVNVINTISVAPARDNAQLLVNNVYGTTPVTTAAYVQLVAATPGPITHMYSFDSSGSLLVIAVGAAGLEVDEFFIPPGGSGAGVEIYIPTGSRVSIKAVDVDATVGYLALTGVGS